MNHILLAGIAGLGAGSILILLTHIAPRFGCDDLIKDPDAARFFGKTFSPRESHAIGVVVHLIVYGFFGMLFQVGVELGMVAYLFLPLSAYAAVLTLFLGGVVLPLEGHGLFGWREDHWLAVDLLIMNALWVLLFALIMSVLG